MGQGHTVADVGELALVERIVAAAGVGEPGILVGPGDDAAVLAAPDGRLVVTTDMLVEGRHFRQDWSTPEDIGHKSVAENLADISAMGADPTGVVMALALPSTTEIEWVDGFLRGALAELRRAQCSLVGGDLVSGDAIVISVTALGDLGGREPVLRSGARPGDEVALCGQVGTAAAGLAVLSRGFRSPRVLVDAHRRPMPDYSAGPRAAREGATAMMDISDGLVLDAGRLARASEVVVAIDSTALPIDDAVRSTAAAYNLDPLTWVLSGGDDHALLATFPPGTAPEGFAVIGSVRPAPEGDASGWPWVVVDDAAVSPSGYEHFRP